MYSRMRVRSANCSSGLHNTVGSRLTPRSYGARRAGLLGRELGLDQDLDLIGDLQGAHERLELLDAELALAELDRAADGAVVADLQRHVDGVAAAGDAEVPAHAHRAVAGVDLAGLEGDLRGAQDLVGHALLDVPPVLVAQRL